MSSPRLHYYSHHGRRKHPISFIHTLETHIFLPIFLLLLATFLATGALLLPLSYTTHFGVLLIALGSSLLRLFIAYVLSMLIGVPLGVIAESNRKVESFLLPIYDVLESVPVIAFFPVIILFFVRSNFLEGAAIFMLFFSMIWSIVFNTIGGLKVIPKEVKAVGQVFGLSRWARFTKITIPALFPPLVTGSILALAAGWNIVIVAEALHAASSGNTSGLLAAMALLIFVIAVINLFIWQPLLGRAERYKFE
jgi:NitT/TauT family transport system permease protein